MLVHAQRQIADAHRAPPSGASSEAEVEVSVPIEAEVGVEEADITQHISPDRQAVGLDGIDLARRRFLELTQIRRGDSKRSCEAHTCVAEGLQERAYNIPLGLD